MTGLTAQAAVIAELTAENTAMRALIAEMLMQDESMIASLHAFGHTPHPAMFPFTDRLRAFARA